MKAKVISFLFIFMITLSLFSQQTTNSLDMAYPPFSQDDKMWLQNKNGLYFEKTEYTDTRVGGYFYKGIGRVSGSTNLISKYTYYFGTEVVVFEDYFNRIGLGDYVKLYNSEREKNISTKWICGGIGLLSLVFCYWGEIDALNPAMDGKYTFGSPAVGWSLCALGAVGGTIGLTIALTPWNPPEKQSDKRVAQLSNDINTQMLNNK